jgi:hypothetical protein
VALNFSSAGGGGGAGTAVVVESVFVVLSFLVHAVVADANSASELTNKKRGVRDMTFSFLFRIATFQQVDGRDSAPKKKVHAVNPSHEVTDVHRWRTTSQGCSRSQPTR